MLLHRVLLLVLYVRVINLAAIVQIFNSCTSRPDIRQWLVIQTPRDNMSKK